MSMRRVSRQLQGTTERVTIAQVMSGRIEKWRDFRLNRSYRIGAEDGTVPLRQELSFSRGSSQRHFGKLRKQDPLLFIIVCRSLLFIVLKATMHVLVPNQFASLDSAPPVAPALGLV